MCEEAPKRSGCGHQQHGNHRIPDVIILVGMIIPHFDANGQHESNHRDQQREIRQTVAQRGDRLVKEPIDEFDEMYEEIMNF